MCIQKYLLVSRYLKFDLLKCNIITHKESSVHQQFHKYDMPEESDLEYLSVPTIKEGEKNLLVTLFK